MSGGNRETRAGTMFVLNILADDPRDARPYRAYRTKAGRRNGKVHLTASGRDFVPVPDLKKGSDFMHVPDFMHVNVETDTAFR